MQSLKKIQPARQNNNTCANSDGLINCLLQPGLFYLRIQQSMREEFHQLFKSYGTLTVPASETKSIGLQANALVPCFLLAIWTSLS